MRPPRLLLGGAAIALAACGAEPELAPSAELDVTAVPRGTPAAGASAASGPQTITLITGDRVTLLPRSTGSGTVVFEPGTGRKRIGHSTVQHGDDVLVLPNDVVPLITDGTVDRALFNVSRLLADGYGDAAMSDIPLLITGNTRAARAGFAASSLVIDRTMPTLRVVAARQPKASPGNALATVRAASAAFAAARGAGPAPKLWLDRRLRPALDHSVAQIGAPAAHARGFTGAGVTVAVLDSGIDSSHPDLAGVVTVARSFVADEPETGDLDGHGTHVASIIAGSGAASNGQYRGVAPDARLINGRVCGELCFTSWLLAGMEWAVVEQRAPIVNFSIGGRDQPGIDPLEEAVNRLSAEHGTLFVVAAGNDGQFGIPVHSPASAEAALAVGAVDRAGELAVFSSRGPKIDGGVIKPELTAPGVAIVAALASGVPPRGTPVGTAYQALSGTSMATPHVVGAAALLLQQHPTWTGVQLKAALMGAADPDPARTADEQGAGRLDIDRATRQHAVAQQVSFDAGVVQWPHADDPITTRTLSYRNTGTAPITLAFAGRLTRPDGSAAPADMIRVAPASVAIAAGATAEVTLQIDTRVDAPDGRYSGSVIATAEDTRVITPVGILREIESYDLTVRTIGLDGNDLPTVLIIAARDANGVGQILQSSGTLAMRIPRNDYTVHSLAGRPVFVAYPGLVLDRTAEITLDSRTAQPIEVELRGVPLVFESTAISSWDVRGNLLVSSTWPSLSTAHAGPAASRYHSGVLVGANREGGELAQPTVGERPGHVEQYAFAHNERGRVVTGWRPTVSRRELATVDSSALGVPPSIYRKFLSGAMMDELEGAGFAGILFGDYAPNTHRTEYLYGPGVTWQTMCSRNEPWPGIPEFQFFVDGVEELRRYAPGQRYAERYFVPPFGPALPMVQGSPPASRRGDELRILATLYNDGGSGRFADSATLRRSYRLLRNGEPFAAEADYFHTFPPAVQVPPGAATYRYEIEHERGPNLMTGEPLFDLSTLVSASWTFRSAHEPSPERVAMTLPTLRFAPELDADGRALGSAIVLPAVIEQSPGPAGAAVPRITDVDVEISFDDGKRWSRVPGVLVGNRWLGLVVHPRGAEFASLRGSVRDSRGQRNEVSILHAYRLTKAK